MNSYDDARVIFDRYDITQSMKQKSRAKRALGKDMELAIHDAIVIAKVTLEELLSASKTNAILSNTHVDVVLKVY